MSPGLPLQCSHAGPALSSNSQLSPASTKKPSPFCSSGSLYPRPITAQSPNKPLIFFSDFFEAVSPYNTGWPPTHNDPPASAFQVLRCKPPHSE